MAQSFPPQARFSTHDSTVPLAAAPLGIPGFNDYREWWADAKSPGNGFTYSVGTIEVKNAAPDPVTGALPLFSGSPARPADGLGFSIPGTPGAPARQVVMLQEAETAGPVLGFQVYYHGTNLDGAWRATNARGISVWPAANRDDMRIAICGETFDQLLPLSNAPGGWPGAGVTVPGTTFTGSSGFIALFNGFGDLLWSHHFFGNGVLRHCAITDVSVRVGPDANGVMMDYVTFCGISTYGNPSANETLTVVQPFLPPSGPCSTSASGSTDNGPNQWDGIVGRLRRPHATPSPGAPEFLSVVGGVHQDALFGIVDADESVFVVVGSTGTMDLTSVTGPTFPVTGINPCPALVNASAGVVAVFRAVPGNPNAINLRPCPWSSIEALA